MKITNWCKHLSAAILAAGIWVPSLAHGVDIPLGDPSFEDFVVPATPGYAYADTYRPTSAWVDDLDSPAGYTQDDANSNWLYSGAYAESGSSARKRPAPRTGSQAMHGGGNYNAQETTTLYEAGKTYTFSIWAQGDDDSDLASSRVWLYMFDASLPFGADNAVTEPLRFAPDTGDFANRAVGMTAEESMANWTQISLSHSVLPGAAEIGNPVGVAVWLAADAAIDDATLTVTPTVPEPATILLVGIGGVLAIGARRRL